MDKDKRKKIADLVRKQVATEEDYEYKYFLSYYGIASLCMSESRIFEGKEFPKDLVETLACAAMDVNSWYEGEASNLDFKKENVISSVIQQGIDTIFEDNGFDKDDKQCVELFRTIMAFAFRVNLEGLTTDDIISIIENAEEGYFSSSVPTLKVLAKSGYVVYGGKGMDDFFEKVANGGFDVSEEEKNNAHNIIDSYMKMFDAIFPIIVDHFVEDFFAVGVDELKMFVESHRKECQQTFAMTLLVFLPVIPPNTDITTIIKNSDRSLFDKFIESFAGPSLYFLKDEDTKNEYFSIWKIALATALVDDNFKDNLVGAISREVYSE